MSCWIVKFPCTCVRPLTPSSCYCCYCSCFNISVRFPPSSLSTLALPLTPTHPPSFTSLPLFSAHIFVCLAALLSLPPPHSSHFQCILTVILLLILSFPFYLLSSTASLLLVSHTSSSPSPSLCSHHYEPTRSFIKRKQPHLGFLINQTFVHNSNQINIIFSHGNSLRQIITLNLSRIMHVLRRPLFFSSEMMGGGGGLLMEFWFWCHSFVNGTNITPSQIIVLSWWRGKTRRPIQNSARGMSRRKERLLMVRSHWTTAPVTEGIPVQHVVCYGKTSSPDRKSTICNSNYISGRKAMSGIRGEI